MPDDDVNAFMNEKQLGEFPENEREGEGGEGGPMSNISLPMTNGTLRIRLDDAKGKD